MEKIAPSTSPQISSPAFTYYPDTGKATLDERVELDTGIKGYSGKVSRAEISRNGILSLRPGFVWNFANWPAINTPSMVYASLAHDATCRLTDEGEVPWSFRKKGDKYFRTLLLQFGEHWFRAWYAYVGVRIGSTKARLLRSVGR